MASRSNATDFPVDWQPQPEAAACLREILAEFHDGYRDLRRFADILREQTGTRLIDWVEPFRLAGERSAGVALGRRGLRTSGFPA